MAFTIAELNAVSHNYFDPTLVQTIYEDSPFFAKLKAMKAVRPEGGINIQWPARVKKLGNAKRTTPRAKVDFESKETRTAATAPWCYYDVTNMCHWDEQVNNGGKGKIIDLMKDKAKEAKEDLQDLLYAAPFLSGADVDLDMATLLTIIDSATTYAGIAVADAPTWAAQEDSSTTVLSLAALNVLRNSATFGTKEPTLHITTRNILSFYEELLVPNMRYEDVAMANLGFSNLTYHKKPVVSDVFCPDDNWFALDMRQYELITHSDYNLQPGDWFELKQAGYPNAYARYMSFVGNLICRNRRTSFKMTAITS